MNSIFMILQIIKITFKTVEISIRANYDTFRSPINAARLPALFEGYSNRKQHPIVPEMKLSA